MTSGGDSPAGVRPTTGPEPYRVELDVFEGPFDLLLQLISQRKLDVTEVGLAAITSDFLARLEGMAEIDLEGATGFLVVAATLVELKATRLLPRDEREELDHLLDEARDLLYARLLEYRAFRHAADVLTELAESAAGYVPREVGLEPPFRDLTPVAPLAIDPDALGRLAAAVLSPRPPPHVDLSHLPRTVLTVREATRRLLARLAELGDTSFTRLVAGLGVADRVVHFLAALELYKRGLVDLAQPELADALLVARVRAPSIAR